MSKIILLLVGVALVAVVQGLPSAQPCYGGGRPYQQYPPYQQQPAPAPAPAPPAPARGPPLTELEQAWYDYYVALEAQAAAPPAPAPAAK